MTKQFLWGERITENKIGKTIWISRHTEQAIWFKFLGGAEKPLLSGNRVAVVYWTFGAGGAEGTHNFIQYGLTEIYFRKCIAN